MRCGAVTAVGIAGAGIVSACSDGGISAEQRTAESLQPLAIAAATDAADARALIATQPDRAAALRVIADERQTHATVLEQEIARLHPAAYQASPSSSAPPSAPGVAPAAPTLADLRSRLTATARTTGDLAVTQNGYRAGMLGSISASVATLVKVQLA